MSRKKYKYKVIVKWFDTMLLGGRVNIIEHLKVIKGKTRDIKRKVKKLGKKWEEVEVIKVKKLK